MIIKHFELTKDRISKFNYYLFHGKNECLKKEIIERNFIKNFNGNIDKYDESYFISNKETIISELLSKSLFEDRKIIIISRVTDKIIKIIDEIVRRNKIFCRKHYLVQNLDTQLCCGLIFLYLFFSTSQTSPCIVFI